MRGYGSPLQDGWQRAKNELDWSRPATIKHILIYLCILPFINKNTAEYDFYFYQYIACIIVVFAFGDIDLLLI